MSIWSYVSLLSISTTQVDEQEIVDNSEQEMESEGSLDSKNNDNTSQEIATEALAYILLANENSLQNFIQLISTSQQELNRDKDEDETGLLSQNGGGSQIHVFFRQKRLLILTKMFNWLLEVGWDEFQFSGIKNYQEQLTFYELAFCEQQHC